MIKFYILSCFILLTYVKSEAQQRTNSKAQEPPKKAAKIIVLVKDSANTLFDRLTLTLFDMGYAIDTKDERLKILSTKEKPSKKLNILTKIQARINDTAIIFTSTMALGFQMELLGSKMEQTYDPVTYYGSKGGAYKVAWAEMEGIARKFGDNIVYSK